MESPLRKDSRHTSSMHYPTNSARSSELLFARCSKQVHQRTIPADQRTSLDPSLASINQPRTWFGPSGAYRILQITVKTLCCYCAATFNIPNDLQLKTFGFGNTFLTVWIDFRRNPLQKLNVHGAHGCPWSEKISRQECHTMLHLSPMLPDQWYTSDIPVTYHDITSRSLDAIVTAYHFRFVHSSHAAWPWWKRRS